MLSSLGLAFQHLDATGVVVWGIGFFASAYVCFACSMWFLTRRVLPALGAGCVLDPRPTRPGQVAREWRQSAVSVLLFGCGLLLPWGLLNLGWARLDARPGELQVVLEVVALTLWNDVHFWLMHRLLHTRMLLPLHGAHHRSVVTTPFATYSFHPIEALLLGNVILWPMLLHDFAFASLVALPIVSLALNAVGHSNYDFMPTVSHSHWFAASRRHHLHHACHRGNYGFQFTFMDRLFRTRLAADAAADLTTAADARRSQLKPKQPVPSEAR